MPCYYACAWFYDWYPFMPVRKGKQKDLRISNSTLLLAVFKWHHGSERVNRDFVLGFHYMCAHDVLDYVLMLCVLLVWLSAEWLQVLLCFDWKGNLQICVCCLVLVFPLHKDSNCWITVSFQVCILLSEDWIIVLILRLCFIHWRL